MSDVATPEVETVETEQPQELTIDEKIEAAIAAQNERVKAEMSGLNRRNSELEKELEDAKIANMTEKEREKHEIAQLKQENEQYKTRQADIERKALITEGLASNSIDPSAMELMREPKDSDSILGWVANFNARVESEVAKRVNERLAGAPTPKSGVKTPSADYQGKRGQDMSKEEFDAYLADTLKE